MFWRAVLAFVACPGMVALVLPLAWAKAGAHPWRHAAGALPLAAGLGLLLWCVREFYVAGKGTLAPWQPPSHLVVSGPYRHSRNPMYLAVTVMLLGWAIGYASFGLLVYGCVVVLAFELRVVFGEEPWLARTFGPQWEQYRRRVPRWWP